MVQALQNHLCATRNPWVLAVQSDLDQGPDAENLSEEHKAFNTWIYPDKIVTISEYAETTQHLLKL